MRKSNAIRRPCIAGIGVTRFKEKLHVEAWLNKHLLYGRFATKWIYIHEARPPQENNKYDNGETPIVVGYIHQYSCSQQQHTKLNCSTEK